MAVRAAGSVTVASITDVASTTRYYLIQASTLTAPAKPTASPPGGSWTATEPTYTEGSTNSLYTCDETVFTDGTWAYSAVSLSTSYEASKAAYNKAVAAANAAAAAQTFVGSCPTEAGTAAKVATVGSGFALASDACVAITFSVANTAASPTLNVNGTGAKAIRLNGAAYAFWVAGATVQFVYDGTFWQVCNTPLYGSTATIGNPGGGNVYVDSDSVDIRQGTSVLGTIAAALWEIGKDSTEAVVKFCKDKMRILSHVNPATSNWKESLDLWLMADCGSDGKTASSIGFGIEDFASETQNESALVLQHLVPVSGTPYDRIGLVADRYLIPGAEVTDDRYHDAIQPVVLYNGGAALSYDTAPGAGTTGTVTLSETAAHFKELTVFFTDDAGYIISTSVPFPNGRGFGCFSGHGGKNGSSDPGVVCAATYSVSGTTLKKTGWFRHYDSNGFNADRCDFVLIVRVEGRR